MEDDEYYGNILPPGGGFRFAVGFPNGLRSSIWSVGTAKKTRDVYLYISAVSEVAKISLHASGQFQYSIHDHVAMQYVSRNADRHMVKWNRPKEFAPGWTRVFYITVPRTEMRYYDVDSSVRLAPDPGGQSWVTIEVLFAEADNNVQLNWQDGAFVLGRIQLADGSGLLAVARPQRPDAGAASHMRAVREGALQAANEERASEGASVIDGSAAAIFLEQEDGTLGVIELAFSEQPSEHRVICDSQDAVQAVVDFSTLRRPGTDQAEHA